MVTLSVENVSHWFSSTARDKGRYQALSSASLSVASGEFVSIVGPSGCGKTTILNVLAGFLKPSAGRVLVNSEPVNGTLGSGVAYMFARDMLLPWRTVLRNVTLPMEMASRRPDVDRARTLLNGVGLNGFEDYYPAQLSQGMRQRVALARTLAVDAPIWLMDEPFGALDAITKMEMQAEFLRIWEELGKTVLFVTHDLMEALVLSDRVLVMSAAPGRIKAEHTIDFPRPRNIMELHSDPTFLEFYRRLWKDLSPDFPLGGDD